MAPSKGLIHVAHDRTSTIIICIIHVDRIPRGSHQRYVAFAHGTEVSLVTYFPDDVITNLIIVVSARQISRMASLKLQLIFYLGHAQKLRLILDLLKFCELPLIMVKVKALVYISPIAIVLHSEKVKIKCNKYTTDVLNSFIKLYNDSGFAVKNVTESTSTLYSYPINWDSFTLS